MKHLRGCWKDPKHNALLVSRLLGCSKSNCHLSCTDLLHLAHAGTDSEPVGGNSAGSGLPPMPGMETTDGPNLAAQMQDAMHNMSGVPAQQLAGQPQNAQQFPVPLPYMLHPGSLMQISPGQHGEVPEGSSLPVGAVNEVGSVASANANLLKLFAAACQHKGLITRTQRAEMADFVQQMYMDRLAQ